MDDLVKRLRAAREQWWLDILIEAADEIERLRAALLWIDTFEPETTAACEAKFGFSMVGWKKTTNV